MRDPIHFAPAGDFCLEDLRRVANAVADEVAVRPLTPHQLFICEPGERPRREGRLEVASWLRSGGMSVLARRVERLLVPAGHVALLAIADARPPSLRLMPLSALPPAGVLAAEPTLAPSWAPIGGAR
jgi:hypothetical protein